MRRVTVVLVLLLALAPARAEDEPKDAGELTELGHVFERKGDFEASLACHRRAFEHAREVGERAWMAEALLNIGEQLRSLKRGPEALAVLREGIALAQALEDDARVSRGLILEGNVLVDRGQHAQAIVRFEKAIELAEAAGVPDDHKTALNNLAAVHMVMRNYAGVIGAVRRLLRLLEESASPERAVQWANLAWCHQTLAQYDDAAEAYEQALRAARAVGDHATEGRALLGLGGIHRTTGRHAEARACVEEALAAASRAGKPAREAAALDVLGNLHGDLFEAEQAGDCFARALAIHDRLGQPVAGARVLVHWSHVFVGQGDYGEAIRMLERALAIFTAHDQTSHVATAKHNLGVAHHKHGDYAAALARYDEALSLWQALGQELRAATILDNMGALYFHLGDHTKSFASHERCYDIRVRIGDRVGLIGASLNLGNVCEQLGRLPEAREHYEQALALAGEYNDLEASADAAHNLGILVRRLGNLEKAAVLYDHAAATYQSIGRRGRALVSLSAAAKIRLEQGRREEAAAVYERIEAELPEVGERRHRIILRDGLARLALAQENPTQAMRWVREALDDVNASLRGLGEQEGSHAREGWSHVADTGFVAARQAGDVESLSLLLETSRANGFLESLSGGEALHAALVPPELRAQDLAARRAERRALSEYQRIRRGGALRAIQSARRDLERARAAREEVVTTIRRVAKAGAAIAYPSPDRLVEIQARLESSDALLLFGMAEARGFALVIQSSGARVVELGATADLLQACEALLLDGKPFVDPKAVAALRKRLIDPLALDASTQRLLVSPIGRLGYVPFALLDPDRAITYVPSATAYGLLREGAETRGEGVLAIGDPDYETLANSGAVAVHRGSSSRALVRLPATRKEVEAVGTVRLLGGDASESGLRPALARRDRWRAVHFACHGLIDPDRPLLSALALSADEENDGLLTCHEVFRLRIPADLVVLSACETGKGRIYQTEGIVGLTRAFMYAGTPRVLCSLWKVDDEATRALMVKFYELWNPPGEEPGLGAAAALREAQEYVKGHEKWSHPQYWAAWVLWGLPE